MLIKEIQKPVSTAEQRPVHEMGGTSPSTSGGGCRWDCSSEPRTSCARPDEPCNRRLPVASPRGGASQQFVPRSFFSPRKTNWTESWNKIYSTHPLLRIKGYFHLTIDTLTYVVCRNFHPYKGPFLISNIGKATVKGMASPESTQQCRSRRKTRQYKRGAQTRRVKRAPSLKTQLHHRPSL